MKAAFHLILVLFLAAAPAAADVIYLEANFNDKNVDLPIGTSGPDLGEPVEVYPGVTAIVRGAPMSSPCLEIQDVDDYMGDFVRFEFFGSAEITTGEVGISAMLWFPAVGPGRGLSIGVREQSSSAKTFANILFNPDGTVVSYDANGPYLNIGTFDINRILSFGLIFDMDAGTYDVWLDGQRILKDETHGITDRGVGAVLLGCFNDSDLDGNFFVDDILVANYLPITPAEAVSWGRVKALFR